MKSFELMDIACLSVLCLQILDYFNEAIDVAKHASTDILDPAVI